MDWGASQLWLFLYFSCSNSGQGLNKAGHKTQLTYTLTLYGFSPLMYFIASRASGIGCPPFMRTPSMSKASAKSSLVTEGGTPIGVLIGEGLSAGDCSCVIILGILEVCQEVR